ncbi:hypothetical protein M0Q28_05740 [Patescibacteria group bacterium]|jgi:hypothetical protein|nr:hypothetical protein [Patescibacteria group bacterium]
MRTPAPIRTPIGTAGPNGVIVVSPAWQEWFQRLSDYYETVSKLIDPGASNFGQSAPDNPSEGLLAYADGVNWDPGGSSSGAGIYFYTSGAWQLFDIGGALLFAPIAKGVTNGDSHDHSGGDGAQVDHVNLASKGTNTHAQVDTHLGAAAPHSGHEVTTAKDAASGYAGLSAASRTTKGVDTTDDLIVDLATKGLVLKDTQGTPHYWRGTISTLGVLTFADLGTSKP